MTKISFISIVTYVEVFLMHLGGLGGEEMFSMSFCRIIFVSNLVHKILKSSIHFIFLSAVIFKQTDKVNLNLMENSCMCLTYWNKYKIKVVLIGEIILFSEGGKVQKFTKC